MFSVTIEKLLVFSDSKRPQMYSPATILVRLASFCHSRLPICCKDGNGVLDPEELEDLQAEMNDILANKLGEDAAARNAQV